MVICNEHQGAVSEAAVGKSINDGDNIPVADALPILYRADGFLVGQTVAYREQR